MTVVPQKLILASQSYSRKMMLEAAGVPFEARSSDVDEGAITRELIGVTGCQIASVLAEAKALAVSLAMPGRLVEYTCLTPSISESFCSSG